MALKRAVGGTCMTDTCKLVAARNFFSDSLVNCFQNNVDQAVTLPIRDLIVLNLVADVLDIYACL